MAPAGKGECIIVTSFARSPAPSLVFLVAVIGIAIFCAMDAVVKGLTLALGAYTTILWRSVAGVLVSSVDANGPAAEKGLQEGDVIIEVDQKAVKTPADVKKRVDDAKGNGYRVVTLLVYRGGDFQWVAVRIDNRG